jgi:hypothetical protein
MACSKYTLTNTGATSINFNYRRCDDSMWEYQVNLNPNETKNIWLIDGTYDAAQIFEQNIVLVDNGAFPPPSIPTPANDLTYLPIPIDDLIYGNIPANNLNSLDIPNDDLIYGNIPANNINATDIPNDDLIYGNIPANNLNFFDIPVDNLIYRNIY